MRVKEQLTDEPQHRAAGLVAAAGAAGRQSDLIRRRKLAVRRHCGPQATGFILLAARYAARRRPGGDYIPRGALAAITYREVPWRRLHTERCALAWFSTAYYRYL